MNSTSDYVSIPPRTDLKPRLIVRKPITSLVLSPTLLQIYCIGLIGPISYSFWVWATICDLTVTILIMYIVAFYSNILIFFVTSLTLIRISLPLPLPFIHSHKNLQPNTTYIQTHILSNCHHHQNVLQKRKINSKSNHQWKTYNPNPKSKSNSMEKERFERKTRYLHQRKIHKLKSKPKPKPSGERDLRGEGVLRVERKEKKNLISDD